MTSYDKILSKKVSVALMFQAVSLRIQEIVWSTPIFLQHLNAQKIMY